MAASESSDNVNLSKVKLGFLEDSDVRLLLSRFFPSKVGGKPAWLSLDPLPESDEVKCDNCGGPTVFLIQIYAPLKREDCFHRTIFIFVCVKESCVKENEAGNFVVLRSQLPLKNPFYSEEPPNEDDLDSVQEGDSSSQALPEHFQNLCTVCGVRSSKKCAKCKKVYYCTREHQTLDWKFKHKGLCNAETERDITEEKHYLLFEEIDLVTEEEEDGDCSRDGKSDEARMEEYQSMMEALQVKHKDVELTEEDLDKAATEETDDDKHFLHFKKTIENEPKQVLRYLRQGKPLWVSAFHKATPEDIPNCKCGAKRVFEFQVMPQLLNHLKSDFLDWGTLCVYTCIESCDIGTDYQQEFIWKQDFYASQANQC